MNTVRGLARGFWSLVLRNPVNAQFLVVAAVGLGTAFGLGWSGLQVGAVTTFSAAVLTFLTNKAVTPIEAPVLPENTVVTVTTPAGEPDRVVTT